MQIVKRIRLLDGSEHSSKQQAERHLNNMLSRGEELKLFEQMAKKNVTELQIFFVENESKIVNTMQIVRELNEVLNLKDI